MTRRAVPILLRVPYREKDEAKALGARWNASLRRWFVPPGVDPEPFARWLPAGVVPPPGPLAAPSPQPGVRLVELLVRIGKAVREVAGDSQWIRADIGHLKRTRAGHVQLELVDSDAEGRLLASVRAVIWKSEAEAIADRFQRATGGPPREGMKVLVRARADYSPQFGLSLIVDDIDPSYTMGDLAARLDAVRQALRQEKLYDRNRRLEPPEEFTRVAVVSPYKAAGLGDFRREAGRLEAAGLCSFTYVTALFQGPDASLSIRRALDEVRRLHEDDPFDAVALIRGGGAKTDLAWLNDLDLARAVATMPLPVLTGIGHERDRTILDEVANRSLDTPSKVAAHVHQTIVTRALAAAADAQRLAAGVRRLLARADHEVSRRWAQVLERGPSLVALAEGRLATAIETILTAVRRDHRAAAEALDLHLGRLTGGLPARLRQIDHDVDERARRLIALGEGRLAAALDEVTRAARVVAQRGPALVDGRRREVELLMRSIVGVGPQATLRRGFALVRAGDHLVTRAAVAREQERLDLVFHDGSVAVAPLSPSPSEL